MCQISLREILACADRECKKRKSWCISLMYVIIEHKKGGVLTYLSQKIIAGGYLAKSLIGIGRRHCQWEGDIRKNRDF